MPSSLPCRIPLWTAFCPVVCRAIVAMLPSALIAASPQVPAGVLNSRGAAISVAKCRETGLPTICRDLAVTPTRRFRILCRIQSSFNPYTSFSPLCRLPLRCRPHAVVVRIVDFSRHPQPMQQDRQLAGHRHHRLLLRALAAFRLAALLYPRCEALAIPQSLNRCRAHLGYGRCSSSVLVARRALPARHGSEMERASLQVSRSIATFR